MVKGEDLWGELKRHGFRLISGVPDSTFGAAYGLLLHDPQIKFVPAVREDVALGVASAAYLCGERGAVVMQNSGVGNVVNALTSFNLVYGIPALLVVGWRGYQGSDANAPEHSVMGEKTDDLLRLLEIPTAVLQDEGWQNAVERLIAAMDASSRPVALLVPPGMLS